MHDLFTCISDCNSVCDGGVLVRANDDLRVKYNSSMAFSQLDMANDSEGERVEEEEEEEVEEEEVEEEVEEEGEEVEDEGCAGADDEDCGCDVGGEDA